MSKVKNVPAQNTNEQINDDQIMDQNVETAKVETEDEKQLREIKEAVAEMQAKAKALKTKIKDESAGTKKATKGIMVTFTNQAGETITGLGNLYYVVRGEDKKLHYKAADAVTIIKVEEKTEA